MSLLTLPAPVEIKLAELQDLATKHPEYIPLPTVADFLGVNAEGLRYSIQKGNCPFGIFWQKTLHGNKAFKIPTATFFLWYTQGMGYKN